MLNKKIGFIRRGLVASTAVLGCSIPAQLLAQDAQGAGTSAASEADGSSRGGIDEIVVTARKKQENLRDVPVAIIAVSGDALEEKAVVRMTDLVTMVPNFTMSLAANVPSTNLRGWGTYGTQFAQSVGKFVDNVSYGRDIHSRIPLFDVQNLEVLKGPQVLLYGNSTTAGALNIATKSPGHEFAANLSASYEFNHQETIVQGGVTVPLGDKAALRVAGFVQNLDKGWLRNDYNGEDEPTFKNRAVRAKLKLEPADGLTISLQAEYDQVRDRGGSGQQIRQSSNPKRQVPDIALDGHRQAAEGGAPFFTPEFYGLNNQTYQADIDLETGAGTLHSTTAYVKSHQSGAQGNSSGRTVFLSDLRTDYDQFSQELRLSGRSGIVDYVIGGYYEWNNYDAISLLELNPREIGIPFDPVSRYISIDQINKSYSLFSDLNFHLSDQFSVSVGARYTWLRQNSDQISDAAPVFPNFNFGTTQRQLDAILNPSLRGNVIALFGGTPHSFNDIKRKESHFQPQVVAQYRPNSNIMLYGKFVRGVKQGGVDLAYGGTAAGAFPNEAVFGPETARSFEVGVKGITANRMLEYSLAVFDTQFKDLQLQAFLGTTQFVTNVGRARTRGVEAEVTLAPADGLRVNGSLNYLDATFQDFPNAPCTVQQLEQFGSPCVQDLSGKPTPFQSKWSGTFNVTYEIDAGDVRITPGMSMLYRSSYSVSTNYDPLGTQGDIATFDLNLAFAHLGSGWKGSIFWKNITDKKYKEYGVATPLMTGAYTIYASRGTSIGIQAGFDF